MRSLIALAAAAALLAACKPAPTPQTAGSGGTVAAARTEPPPAPPPPIVKPEDWKAALESAYVARDLEDAGEGVQTFFACFSGPFDGKKCETAAFGRRDGFNKTRFFTPVRSRMLQHGGTQFVASDIVVMDCGKPHYVLRPNYFSKRGWLFMNRVAVMVDGDVLLDLTMENDDVKRKNETWGVEERGLIIAHEKEIEALRKVAVGKTVVIRITGSEGYVLATKDANAGFPADVANALAIYDKLSAAVADKIPASCS